MSDQEEEDDNEEVQIVAKCKKCQRLMKSDGSNEGGDATCKHKYAPFSKDQEDIVSPSPSSVQAVEPTLPEAAAMHEVTHNLTQTEKFIEKVEQDRDRLEKILDDRQTDIENEFESMIKLLKTRQGEITDELQARYEERYTLMEDELDKLKKHKKDCETTKQSCLGLIQTMDIRDAKRTEEIRKLCKECLDKTPSVKEVPIEIAVLFNDQKRLSQSCTKYGKLKCEAYNCGQEMKYVSADIGGGITPIAKYADNNEKKNNNNMGERRGQFGGAISSPAASSAGIASPGVAGAGSQGGSKGSFSERNDKIILPTLKRVNMRYKPAQNHVLIFEPILRDPALNGNDEKEYENGKKNTFVHIQCIGNESKASIDKQTWNVGIKRFEKCVQLPQPDRKGKYYIEIPNDCYERQMWIHTRARLLYLRDKDGLDNDGIIVDSSSIVIESDWSDEKATQFTGADGHKCTFAKVDEFMIPPSSQDNDNSGNSGNRNGGDMAYGAAYGAGYGGGYDDNMDIEHDDNENNNKNNNNMNGESGNQNGEADEPVLKNKKKAKVKCQIIVNGQSKMKMFPIKEDYTYQDLIAKTKNAGKAPNATFKFCLKDDENVTIYDENSFIKHCVNPDPDENGYNAYLTATAIE